MVNCLYHLFINTNTNVYISNVTCFLLHYATAQLDQLVQTRREAQLGRKAKVESKRSVENCATQDNERKRGAASTETSPGHQL